MMSTVISAIPLSWAYCSVFRRTLPRTKKGIFLSSASAGASHVVVPRRAARLAALREGRERDDVEERGGGGGPQERVVEHLLPGESSYYLRHWGTCQQDLLSC